MSRADALRRADAAEALAARLLDFARDLRTMPEPDAPPGWPIDQLGFARTIESLLALRRLRAAYVDARMFGEPAWELLLALFQAHLGGGSMQMESLLQDVGPYPSTTRRWLDALEELGLVSCDDQSQGPVRLTDAGVARMTRALVAMQEVADFTGRPRTLEAPSMT